MLGLVLGGGAAKGYAHIGVLKVLEDEGIQPDLIVGASMGALIGGFYAAGYTAQEIADMARTINTSQKRWLLTWQLSKKGFVDGSNVVKYIEKYLDNKKIEKLPIQFAVVTSDIERYNEVVINKGDLIKAIRAAIAIPGIFTPLEYKGRILIDGGFVNPLPIRVALQLGATKIIAVNVLRKINYQSTPLTPRRPSHKNYTIKHVITETIECITQRLMDYEIMHMKEGLVINLDTEAIGMSQFEKAKQAIFIGLKQAQKYRKSMASLAGKQQQKTRSS